MMKKKSLLNSNETVVWVILIMVTVVSYLVFEDLNVARIAVSIAVVIGAIKAHLIFIHFMELRWEPRPCRILFEIWTLLVTIIILGGYWFTTLNI